MIRVTVTDYGMGNLLSVERALQHCGAAVEITSTPSRILAADRVILPGVGAFSAGMAALNQTGLGPALRAVAEAGTPLLGICLGMQMLMDESEEFGLTPGLGLVPGRVIEIPGRTVEGSPLKRPHIGWNELRPSTPSHDWSDSLLATVEPGTAGYFVHSFMAVPDSIKDRLANCLYGGHSITAAIKHANITGCQFHPEKSGEAGLKMLKSFLDQS